MRKPFTLCDHCVWAVLIAAVVFPCLPALGDGYRNPPAGAAALGRSGAYGAHVTDASAVSVNPAALADLEERSLVVQLTWADAEIEFENLLGMKNTSGGDAAWLPQAFVAFPWKEGVAVGVGVTTPYGQSVEWGRAGNLRYAAPYSAKMDMVDVQAAVGLQLDERLALGAGLDVYQSELSYHTLFDNGPVPGEGVLRLDADGTALGGHAGLTWDIVDGHRLAVTYRSGFELEYEGDARLSGAPVPVPPRDDLETAIDFPHIIALAYGVELTERLRIEADVEWLEWSANDALDLDVERYTGLVPPSLRNDWDDTWTFALGGDYRLNDAWRLYAGYAYLETPVPDETYVPIVADADRQVISIGAEWQHAGQTLGIAYAANVFEDRDVTANVNPGLNGEYTYKAHLVSLTYALNW